MWLYNECRQVQVRPADSLSGILIDSVSITVHFDPISAKSFRIELEAYLNILLADKHIEIQDNLPICGKLNWFAELVQSGRMHITSCWNYRR